MKFLEQEIKALEKQREVAEQVLSEVVNSRSWRLTASLRFLGSFLKAGK